jgi:site-specific DNA-methyltransferase (adenine-specific)
MTYPNDFINQVIQGDCLEVMPAIADKSIDMILCDLPYGTTACKWDTIIPFEPLWEQYKRIIKENGAIVLTAREPFTSKLIVSNINNYKHKWVWNKKQSGSFQNAKYMPLQIEEDIIVFCNGKVNYFPIMRKGKNRKKGGCKKNNELFCGLKGNYSTVNNLYFPVNIIEFPNCSNKKNNIHPTQKPVALFEYLIKTYANEGDLVLDNCAGSGTTGVACKRLNRRFILIEQEEKYCKVARDRLANEPEPLFKEAL